MFREVYFDGTQVITRETQPPQLAADEALIDLRLGGVCSTDLALMNGYYDFRGVLGHEFVGTVRQGPEDWPGQRVVGEINIGCDDCIGCLQGDPRHCPNRSVLGILGGYGGAFGDVFKLPIRNLHRVPDGVSDAQAVFVEPLAAAAEILEQVHVSPSARVVVVGVGRLGMLCVQVLHQTGAEVIGVVRHDKQRVLLQKWGIVAATYDELTPHSADIVVEATGNPSGLKDALGLIRHRGTLVLKSTYAGSPAVDLSRIVVDELHIVGSRCGPFDVALRLLANKQIDVESMIEARYALDNAPQALQHAAERGVLKVLLQPKAGE